MPNPLAAHTFDSWRIYLSERDNAAPGAGTWSANELLYDGNLVTPQYLRASTFSAGALSAGDPRGIVVKSDISSGSSRLLFLGEGLPDAPIPVSVTVGAFESFDSIDFWDTTQGVWNYGSDLYLAGYLNQSPSAFWLIKSTNGGTSWTRLTHANAPPGDGELAAIQRINDTLYFFAPSDTLGTGNFALYALNIATGTWAAPTAALPASGIAEFCIAAHGKWSNGLVVYPDGDVGIFYVSSALGFVPAYREWNGASWGAAVALPGEACANMIIDPGQELIHVFTYDGIFDEDDVIYSKVAHGGAVTPSIFTIPGVPASDGVGHSSIQNDKIFVPRDDNVVNSVWVALLSDGQFVEEVLPTPSDETNKIQSLSISNAGSGYTASTYVRIDGYAGTNPTYGFISAVNGSGGVTSFSFGASAAVPIGGGYSVGIVGTTPGWTTPAVGTGLTVNITAIAAKPPSCAYMMFPNGFAPETGVNAEFPLDLTFTASVLNSVAAVCPVSATATIGTAYVTLATTVTGGTPPYTFSAVGLPPGLTINPATGIISGTPTMIGTFPYTITVTDADGNTFDVACSILVVAASGPTLTPPHTLRWQIPQKRWFPHSYNDRVIVHYLDEASASDPNDMQLLMPSGSAVLISGGNTDNGVDIDSRVTTPSNDGGDERLQKLFIDAMFDADGTGPLSSYIQYNNQTLPGPTLLVNPAGTRAQYLENISSLANLSLYRNISTTLYWTGGPDGPRVYAWEPAGYQQPYISQFFVTQFINLAFPAWKHHRRLYAGLISVADILFTIKTQDGRVYGPITIPSTAGQFRIFPLMVPHGCKDLAFAYEINGQGTNFALFKDAWTIETKDWVGPEYIDLAIYNT